MFSSVVGLFSQVISSDATNINIVSQNTKQLPNIREYHHESSTCIVCTYLRLC